MVALCCAPSEFVFSAKGTDASMLMSALDIGFPWPNAGSDMRVLPQIAATIICFSDIVRFRLLRTRNSEQSSGRAQDVLSVPAASIHEDSVSAALFRTRLKLMSGAAWKKHAWRNPSEADPVPKILPRTARRRQGETSPPEMEEK